MPSRFPIDPEQLMSAIMTLNSMSPCDGVIMTRQGEVKVGYRDDADLLCMLLPAPVLARMLTADGLSSYSVKELKKWISELDTAPLQAIADAAAEKLAAE